MALFKKKAKAEEIDETEVTEAPAAVEEDTGDAQEEASAPKKPRDLHFALIRCGGALVVAAALLFATGFSAISLFRGPADSVSVQDEANGAFVKKEIIAIIANYAPESSKDIYAVVPMNGALVTVDFSGRYADSVATIMDETNKLIAGEIAELDKYVVVQGTVSELSEEQSKEMYDWFDANQAEMVEKHVISESYGAAEYLSDKVLLVDTVDGRSQTLVMVLSGLAVLLVLYVIAELVLMALGFYKPEKTEEAAVEEAADAETAGEEMKNPKTPDNADGNGEDKQ